MLRNSSSNSEISDAEVFVGLPVIADVIRHMRSKGPVADLPNVQNRILERKKK